MRSVRCDVCGTKALMAASKCPKCSNPLAVRDGFGDLLPMAHCPTCDSDYPASAGACKWCGTPPEKTPIGPYVWKGVGIAAFLSNALDECCFTQRLSASRQTSLPPAEGQPEYVPPHRAHRPAQLTVHGEIVTTSTTRERPQGARASAHAVARGLDPRHERRVVRDVVVAGEHDDGAGGRHGP